MERYVVVRRQKRVKRRKRKKPTARPKPRRHDDNEVPVEGTDELPPSGGTRTIGESAARNGN